MGWHGGHSLPLLIAGIVVIDLGVQGNHVTNLAVIYRLRPESRSSSPPHASSPSFWAASPDRPDPGSPTRGTAGPA